MNLFSIARFGLFRLSLEVRVFFRNYMNCGTTKSNKIEKAGGIFSDNFSDNHEISVKIG